MSLIDIRNLNFEYGKDKLKVPIFKSCHLQVNKGDFVAIKGPSGTGKSTLLYLLSGLLRAPKDSIFIDGVDVSSMKDFELAQFRNSKIGLVFQQFYLLPKINVLENILLPSQYPVELKKLNSEGPKKMNDKALELATFLGLEKRLQYMPNQLSGGQQQRVAIARGLINDADIILADEPTGNLDVESTKQIVKTFQDLHERGKTIILITHEEDVARCASRVISLENGQFVEDQKVISKSEEKDKKKIYTMEDGKKESEISLIFKLLPMALTNAFRNKTRSFLTMIGIIIGVAAVCSMITLGEFTKVKILNSYARLGVSTLRFRGYPNWKLKATDVYPNKYRFFKWEGELVKLKKIFPQIELISPGVGSWESTVSYGGLSIHEAGGVEGGSEDALSIINRKIIHGRGINKFHVQNKNGVCVIGSEIAKRLFRNSSPLKKVLNVKVRETTFPCKVIGVLEETTSNKKWDKPNLKIFVPFTFYQANSSDFWSSQIKHFAAKIKSGHDPAKVGNAIKAFFEKKYGVSGNFFMGSDSVLISQMKKFLTLFSILLSCIALVTLLVGGMGITNMMLVSVSERLKEIGIRKSIGATHRSIKTQFLLESFILSFVAGVIGMIMGILGYSGAIYVAAKLIKELSFEWIFDPFAILLSFMSIIIVGILSGLIPAIKASKLQVIDALRNE
jgi:macrolide transport system ATP-binding/permease protein